jgi:DNA-binding CsgD family transcriptional regulator/tetratricopeptide (TPR) repeat protein
VGRAEELALLASGIDAARHGRSGAVLIGGDAGVGKTRLVDEAAERARADGALVASGGCAPMDGGGLAYGSVVAVLRSIARQVGDGEAAQLLGPLAPGLGSLAPSGDEPPAMYSGARSVSEGLAKTRLYESVLLALGRVAAQSPLVVVVEDLHWADSGTADLLSFLIRNLTDERVLIVGTYRSDELGRDHHLHAWLHELARVSRVQMVSLPELDRAQTAEMIAGILGEDPPWSLVEAVWNRSEGNAFYVEELTAARQAPALSPELREVILGRLDSLSTDAHRVLAAVATIGMVADHNLLVAVLAAADPSGADDRWDVALAEAVDHQVLVVDTIDATYRFRHILLREAVYGALLPGERARWHGAIARVLVDRPDLGPAEAGHRVAELSVHWWECGDWSAALSSSVAAADAAAAVWALPESHVYLERALAALDRLPDDEAALVDRRRLVERAADAAYWAAEAHRCVELAQQLIDLVSIDGDPAEVARAELLLGRNAWSLGDSDGAFAAYRRAAALVPAEPPSQMSALLSAEEARGLLLLSRFVEAEERAVAGLQVARAVGARAEEAHLLCTIGCSRAAVGFADEGVDLLRDALAISEEVGNADAVNRAYVGLTAVLGDAGRLDECLALLYDAAALGEEMWGVRLTGAASNCVAVLTWLGRLDEAEALVDQVGRGVGNCIAGPSMSRAELALRRGRFDEADGLLDLVDELTGDLADVQFRGPYHLMRADLAVGRSDLQLAADEIELALATAAGTDDTTYLPLMLVAAVRCQADRYDAARADGQRFDLDKARLLAAGFVDEATQTVAGLQANGGVAPPRAVAAAAQCMAEATRLEVSDPQRWVEAATAWAAAHEPEMQAYCEWREAEAWLAGRSGRARAETCLRDAWSASSAMGTQPLTDRIEALARRARVGLDASDAGGDEPDGLALVGADLGLTPREVEVLALLAAGRRDAEIADELFISKKTASVHVSNVLRKLDVPNRIEAGRIGQAHGLG